MLGLPWLLAKPSLDHDKPYGCVLQSSLSQLKSVDLLLTSGNDNEFNILPVTIVVFMTAWFID